MKKRNTILGIGIAFLFIAASLPVSSHQMSLSELQEEETLLVENLMNQIEQAACESTSFEEFLIKISSLYQRFSLNEHPMLQTLIQKIFSYIISEEGFFVGCTEGSGLLTKSLGQSQNQRPDKFVISCGSYNRLSPKKENTFKLFKERLSFWHYGGKTKLFQGKTLVIERRPFEIKQKIHGPQFGMMRGFKGLYIDFESKLTGNAYVFFIGRAKNIRAFDLTPFSSK